MFSFASEITPFLRRSCARSLKNWSKMSRQLWQIWGCYTELTACSSSVGWGFDCLSWSWGRAFDWSCSPRGGDIWIFLRPTWRYLTADSDEKDWDRTYVSHFHASRMRRTVWNDQEIMDANENKRKLTRDFTVLSSNVVCFSVFMINWISLTYCGIKLETKSIFASTIDQCMAHSLQSL